MISAQKNSFQDRAWSSIRKTECVLTVQEKYIVIYANQECYSNLQPYLLGITEKIIMDIHLCMNTCKNTFATFEQMKMHKLEVHGIKLFTFTSEENKKPKVKTQEMKVESPPSAGAAAAGSRA